MDISDGVKLFNVGNYFEAHDVFEELWMCTVGKERNFYQGLVQISVGTYHLSCKNFSGALSQYSKGIKKIEKYPDYYKNINILKLKEEINYLKEEIFVFYSKKSFNLKVTKIPFIELNAKQNLGESYGNNDY